MVYHGKRYFLGIAGRALAVKFPYSAFGDLLRKASDLSSDMTEDLQYFEQSYKLSKRQLDDEEHDDELLEHFQAMECATENYCAFAASLLTTEAGKSKGTLIRRQISKYVAQKVDMTPRSSRYEDHYQSSTERQREEEIEGRGHEKG